MAQLLVRSTPIETSILVGLVLTIKLYPPLGVPHESRFPPAKPTMIMTPLWFSAFPQLHDSAQLGDSRLSFKLKSWLFFQQYGTVMLRYYLRETVLQVGTRAPPCGAGGDVEI